MRLERLIDEAALERLGLGPRLLGDGAVEVTSVSMDSRHVAPGGLFACVPGAAVDGHAFASAAVESGATCLLCEHPVDVLVPQVIVTSVRHALGPISDVVYGRPSAHLVVAGVTGTNGKTTTCAFLQAIFRANGWRASSIGTLSSPRTTPEAPELHAALAEWRASGGRAVAMEVSSHALDQHRTDSVRFAVGAFTNLSPEHLDYHGTMEAYFEAKARLFQPGQVGVAVVNRDDPWGARLADRLSTQGFGGGRMLAYAASEARDVVLEPSGSRFSWGGQSFAIHLGGLFNVANAVAAIACARALDIAPEVIATGLASVQSVPGRFQLVDAGQPFTVIVDYAHTPDGLTKVLSAAKQVTQGRLIVVFGAGGDRDREKRPLMGEAAVDLADLVVVTSDNPRSEDPGSIIAEIMAPVGNRENVLAEPDRAAAIATAVGVARPGDVVVVAGKGHEKGQEIAGRVLPFDDVEVARAAITRIRSSREPGGVDGEVGS